MKFSRIGESLWSEWDGEDFEPSDPDGIIFYTEAHVDLDQEVVRRALASTIQRDGSVNSLGDAYRALQEAPVVLGHAGTLEGELVPIVCDQDGQTYFGDIAENVFEVTWVEISSGS